ncbi:hypothetical protein M8C21_017859 [Ambrosia artemisiifolia]|uniref:Protein kinase domain-containing protein n=1 Tax=Ambrosia artemisiifolia TaxID=4212 RepID=A0AAD5C7P3_AMBAR|nr:hypothetical protein M8C21_017859 [Ambrosia artemisiifolia]
MDGWMVGLAASLSPIADALGQLLVEYAQRIYNSQLQHLKDIAGTLATKAAEDATQVAKLCSALESVDHMRRKDQLVAALPVDELIEKADGFAGVFPEHKYEIVKILQMDDATDAARGASDIVLTEPGLSVIISVVLTSRAIFQRMKNYIFFMSPSSHLPALIRLDHVTENVALTSRIVRLSYRPPELLLGSTCYGMAVDLWSTGCILGELANLSCQVEQLHKIFKLCGSPSEDYCRKSNLQHSTAFKPTQPYRKRVGETFIDVPSVAIKLMENLLAIDPSLRGTVKSALESERPPLFSLLGIQFHY